MVFKKIFWGVQRTGESYSDGVSIIPCNTLSSHRRRHRLRHILRGQEQTAGRFRGRRDRHQRRRRGCRPHYRQ